MNDLAHSGLIVAIVLIALLAIAGWLLTQRTRSRRLEERFGPEYRRAVEEYGSPAKAERELMARQARVEKLNIVPLSPADAATFGQQWKSLQAQFVDNPVGVVAQADALVRQVMATRGYPMGDFERRAADISVDHPHVVDHYRAAQAIATRSARGEADTEALRKALVHYRALFEDLLLVESSGPSVHLQPREVHR
jgi:hypothetical protein